MKNSSVITQQILNHYLMASSNSTVGIALWSAAMKFIKNQSKDSSK